MLLLQLWRDIRGLKIGIGYCYYNDVESIKRGIPTFIDSVDLVFAIDGKFSLREGEDYSTDGSTEYLSQFKNVIIRKFVGLEHHKRQQYVNLAREYNIDVLIIIDSDEYVIEADWNLFRENLTKMDKESIHGLRFMTCGSPTPYPRIWTNLKDISYGEAHCIFNVGGSLIRSPNNLRVVEGLVMAGDDMLRDEKYLNETSEYQKKMIEFEKPYRKLI